MKVLLAFCFLSLISPLALFPQPTAWSPVQALRPGERVEVKLFSGGARIRGSVEQVTDETLVIRHKKSVATLGRADVRRIRIDSGRKSKFGQILGLSTMAAVAVSADVPRWNRGADIAFAAGSGYLLGWGIDGMVNDYRRQTIYEGQPSPQN